MFMQEHWVAAVPKQHRVVSYISSEYDKALETDLEDLLREKWSEKG